jgi:hypothetical protein
MSETDSNTPAPAHPPGFIAPSIGRKLWYWPVNQPIGCHDTRQAFDATVVFVHPNGRVNLVVRDHEAVQHAVLEVLLVQEGEPRPMFPHATWMPFQVGQAKKG